MIVVSAGNHNLGWTRNSQEAEQILDTYPAFLLDPQCGLCEPATAAIPVTVGGFAAYDVPAMPSSLHADDIVKPIACVAEPTPTTRIGPGIEGAIKPEFVASGGNLAFRGYSTIREVMDDEALGVMSFSHEPLNRLFAFDIGSSLAAPVVARSAAILLDRLKLIMPEEPDANLVRALLASAATHPCESDARIRHTLNPEQLRHVYGYGSIDDDILFDSADRRVTMITQAEMPLDTVAIYEVPCPLQFRKAKEKKSVIVTLAFDPPVRRRRANYLGVKMDYALIRGKTVDEIVEAYRKLSAEEANFYRKTATKPQGAFESPFKCDLKPGSQALQANTLQRSEWRFTAEKKDYGDSWYLVIRAIRTWAPESFAAQRFAATVTLQADEPELYNLIQQRVQNRQQQRVRTRR